MSNMSRQASFDHAVIMTGIRMDDACTVFARLGFQLTERGHHTLGSINHLIVLGDTYLELLGLPPDRPDARPELRDSPLGLDALVFGSDDAGVTHQQVLARGGPVGPVQQFSRPVRTPNGDHDAVFRTVRCLPGSAQAGRLYFCEHLTPELVWQPAARAHPNGALELVQADLQVADPEREAVLYRRLLGDDAVKPVTRGFEAVAQPVRILIEPTTGQSVMTGLTIRVQNLVALKEQLTQAGVSFDVDAASVCVPASEAWNIRLCFVE